MGTDICILFEYFDPEQGCWKVVTIGADGDEYDVDFMEDCVFEKIDPLDWDKHGIEHDTNRGYPLFDLLAGIRGDTTGKVEREPPLAEPRGFPEDSAYYRCLVARNSIEDNHTHTYFTLTELMNADTAHNRYYREYERMAKIIQPLIMVAREWKIPTDNFRAIISFC